MRNPPETFARSALATVAQLPGVYGAPVTEAVSDWLSYSMNDLTVQSASDLARLAGPTGCLPHLARISADGRHARVGRLLKRCGSPHVKPAKPEALDVWQVVTALLLDHEARQRGLARTALHRRVLATITEPHRVR